ncbi:MAG: hypothetical protein JXB23_10985, partial [Candidatus Aminicenantes bacterium]|nr:hypothetical protein [Candidatus Aminicenantes bacterium]
MKQPLFRFMTKVFNIHVITGVLMLAVLFTGIGLTAQSADLQPMMTVTLKPGPANKDGHVGYVDVTITLQPADSTAGEPLLMLPIVFANVETVAKTMKNFEAADAKGALLLEVKDDPGDSPVSFRRWVPN